MNIKDELSDVCKYIGAEYIVQPVEKTSQQTNIKRIICLMLDGPKAEFWCNSMTIFSILLCATL